MLETIREYAGETARAPGESDDRGRRHAELFLRLAERTRLSSAGRRRPRGFDATRCTRTTTSSRRSVAPPRAAGEASTARCSAGRFWQLRSHLAEGEAWVAAALDADARPRRASRACPGAQPADVLPRPGRGRRAPDAGGRRALARGAGRAPRDCESARLPRRGRRRGARHEARGTEAMDASDELARRLGDRLDARLRDGPDALGHRPEALPGKTRDRGARGARARACAPARASVDHVGARGSVFYLGVVELRDGQIPEARSRLYDELPRCCDRSETSGDSAVAAGSRISPGVAAANGDHAASHHALDGERRARSSGIRAAERSADAAGRQSY